MLINANSLHIPLRDKSVHCVITSPPYFQLREYGTAKWEGGDPACDHSMFLGGNGEKSAKQVTSAGTPKYQYRDTCAKCGATRTDHQLGLERVHDCLGWATGNSCGECYTCRMRQVAAEIWRVLRDDGTFFLNLGDSYAQSGMGGNPDESPFRKQATNTGSPISGRKAPPGLKPKDIVGIPWHVAFALQHDGWFLRSDIIWHLPNPMPESMTDRCTSSHEYVFMLSKSPRYYFDSFAIRERSTNQLGQAADFARDSKDCLAPNQTHSSHRSDREHTEDSGYRNKRDVWTIPTHSYKGAHYATFPIALVEPMVLAGSSAQGVCPTCGKPYERIVSGSGTGPQRKTRKNDQIRLTKFAGQEWQEWKDQNPNKSIGWQQVCSCPPADPVPSIVLDPFAGSGTVGAVCRKHNRRFIGLDLSYTYLHDQAMIRAEGVTPKSALKGLPIFDLLEEKDE